MRTEIGSIELKSNNKFCVSFVTYKGKPGDEYVAFEATSAPVFDSEDEAKSGAIRALAALENTGRFPNMCDRF